MRNATASDARAFRHADRIKRDRETRRVRRQTREGKRAFAWIG